VRRSRDIAGLRVLITGATGGIGTAAAEALSARGARVLGIDLAEADDVIAADIRDDGSVQRAVAMAVERLGGLDVLVNNAGVGAVHDAGQAPDERARATLDINLLGTWRVTSAALPHLLESGGRVVNVASMLALVNVPLAAAYCASKRGLSAYSDVLRLEYGDRIRVTTIYPGYIRTAIHDEPARAGVSLDGVTREEPVEAAARAIARACTSSRRDLATSRVGGLELAIARHMPRLVDSFIMRRISRGVRTGRWADSELTSRLRERLRGARDN
jgi:NAD(P)-dependent dehydrogenase (short-subunit alcohol dehydrogenase family)